MEKDTVVPPRHNTTVMVIVIAQVAKLIMPVAIRAVGQGTVVISNNNV